MKKSILLYIIVLFGFGVNSNIFAQTIKEGKVKFKIEYLKVSPEASEFKDQLPTTYTLFFKERKSRIETQSPEAGNLVIISNAIDNTTYTLLDLPTSKIALEQKGEDQKADREAFEKNMTVTESNETKTICGYICKKAIVNFIEDGKPNSTTIFYTSELSAANNNQYSKVNGFLMEFEEIDDKGSLVRVTAQEFTKQEVKDDKFIIPTEYTRITEEEFIDMMGE